MSKRNDLDPRDPRASRPLGRRDLLKLFVAGGAASSVFALPSMRNAHGMLRPDAPAKRVLVLYFGGGIRSSTAFHASPATIRYNPWGAIEGTNTPFSLGKLLDDFLPAGTPISTPETPPPDAAYQLSPMGGWAGMRVPRLREIAGNMSVVGTWNSSRGDHYRASTEESTGTSNGSEGGLLTRIGAGLGSCTAPTPDDVPTFHVQPGAAFGHATEDQLRFTPVPIFGTGGLPGRGQQNDEVLALTGFDWTRDEAMSQRLDDRRVNSRSGFGRGIAEVYRGDKLGSRRIGVRLAEPWINPTGDEMAARGTVRTETMEVPLTNAMLREVFVRALGPDPMGDGAAPYPDPDNSGFFRTAMDVALAIRLLQLGSAGAVVEIGGFDTHSGERQEAPARFRFLGRLWATINWILSRIPEPGEPDKTMLDRTLVFTTSEFGRDGGSATTGFNNGDGSDHGNDPSCYYLAHGIMGGGVIGGRFAGPAPASTYVPAMADRISSRRLLASALWSLGLDSANPEWGFPDVTPITQLWTP